MAIRELDIQNLAESKSYIRGKDYFKSNAVINIEKRGNRLLAEVEGSNYTPYKVDVEVSKDSIVSTYCNCPYSGEGICKHIVAVLLKYINKFESIEELPTIEELLSNLKESDLREILIDILESEPHLTNHVENKITTLSISELQKQVTIQSNKQSALQSQNQPKSQPVDMPIAIDTSSFKRKAKQIVKNSNRSRDYHDNYYYEYDDEYDYDIADQFMELFNNAKPLLEVGDGKNSLAILESVIEVFVDSWSDEDYYYDINNMLDKVASLFTEAILSSEFSIKEKKSWIDKLTQWQENISKSGDSFALPIAALEQGWDYPPLQAVFEGSITEKGAWDLDEGEQCPDYADDLSIIRLRILERQGLTQKYLYLAEAEGMIPEYLTMLVKLDRSKEAVEYLLKYPLSSKDTITVVTAMYDKGLFDDALKLADHTLTTLQDENFLQNDNNFLLLARWLRDNAQQQSNIELRLKGAEFAFKHSLGLEDYRAVEAIATANAQWETLKIDLLDELNKRGSDNLKVKIYFYEKMYKKVIEVIDTSKNYYYWDSYVMKPIVDAVYKEFPDWAIKHCKRIAEPDMDNGKSKQYRASVLWVEKIGKIYIEARRTKEWKEYLEGLIKKHHHKYSLRPQLEALRS